MSELTVTWLPRPTDEQFDVAARLLAGVIDKVSKGEFTVEDLRERARRGDVLVGIGYKEGQPVLTGVLSLVHYPQLTAVNMLALAGKGLQEFAEQFFDEVKAFARSMGAKRIEASVTPAMAVMARWYGFEPLYEKVGCSL